MATGIPSAAQDLDTRALSKFLEAMAAATSYEVSAALLGIARRFPEISRRLVVAVTTRPTTWIERVRRGQCYGGQFQALPAGGAGTRTAVYLRNATTDTVGLVRGIGITDTGAGAHILFSGAPIGSTGSAGGLNLNVGFTTSLLGRLTFEYRNTVSLGSYQLFGGLYAQAASQDWRFSDEQMWVVPPNSQFGFAALADNTGFANVMMEWAEVPLAEFGAQATF